MDQKGAAKKLIKEITVIDDKIEEFHQNGTDLTSPLVDKEDYPLPNMDLYAVRTARHNIRCLQNDRQKLADEVEKLINSIHEETKLESLEIDPKKVKPSEETHVHRTSNRPFVKIEQVIVDSPAYKVNMKSGDLVVQFGTLHADNFTKLAQLPELVQRNIDKAIKLTVVRNNHPIRLEVIPSQWEGNGVLGCAFSAVTNMFGQ